MTNRKPHMPFRLVPKSTTLDDLERPILSKSTQKLKIDPYYQRQKCRPLTLVSGDKVCADIRRGSLERGRQMTVDNRKRRFSWFLDATYSAP